MSKNGQHVVPSAGGWSVRRSGSGRASGIYGTQAEAIEAGMRIAKNQRTELYIYGRDGLIRERLSYDVNS